MLSGRAPIQLAATIGFAATLEVALYRHTQFALELTRMNNLVPNVIHKAKYEYMSLNVGQRTL